MFDFGILLNPERDAESFSNKEVSFISFSRFIFICKLPRGNSLDDCELDTMLCVDNVFEFNGFKLWNFS